jgi:hypothetical protein
MKLSTSMGINICLTKQNLTEHIVNIIRHVYSFYFRMRNFAYQQSTSIKYFLQHELHIHLFVMEIKGFQWQKNLMMTSTQRIYRRKNYLRERMFIPRF